MGWAGGEGVKIDYLNFKTAFDWANHRPMKEKMRTFRVAAQAFNWNPQSMKSRSYQESKVVHRTNDFCKGGGRHWSVIGPCGS